MKSLALLAITLLAASRLSAQITANFTTNLGNFSVDLNYNAAPQTVASFITLAEGSRPWIDPRTGQVRYNTPFYNGIIFHRVVKNFIIQAGSPKGDGTDGPGYSFKDELNNGLNHSAIYTLSMANSGPNTNGSQFFITTGSASFLDGKHTVFGSVTSGQSVVESIDETPLSGSLPITPVIIQSVTIQRTGTEAQNFDEFAQNLPTISGHEGSSVTNNNGVITWNPPNLANDCKSLIAYSSTTLDASSWTPLSNTRVGLDDPIPTQPILGNASDPKQFYHLSKVADPTAYAPSHLRDRTLTIPQSGGVLSLVFDETGSAGTLTYTPTTGTPLGGPFTLVPSYNRFDTNHVSFVSDCQSISPRYLFHKLGFDSANATELSGHLQLQNYNGSSFVDFSSGSFTLSR